MTNRPSTGRRGKALSAEDAALWRRVADSMDRKLDRNSVAAGAVRSSQSAEPPKAEAPKEPVKPPPRVATPRAVKSEPKVSFPQPKEDVQRLSASAPGLDHRTARRLARGDVDPSATLDLHGYDEARAHQALIGFIVREQSRGSRCVAVITGKGGRGGQDADAGWYRAGGVLRRMTPIWLRQAPLGALVTNVFEAPRHRGGQGALYVYLRKKHK